VSGYGHAAAVLTERGIRTPRGGKWTRAAVRSLIQRHVGQLPAPQEPVLPQGLHPSQQQRQVA
jgi:Recombinase